MDENKFYTPDKNELRIGLHYEMTSPYYPEIWIKETMNNLTDLVGETNSGHGMNWTKESHYYNEDGSINPESLRIKFLDAKDIESFEFKLTEENFFELGERWYISWYPEVRRVEIGDEENSQSFAGTIKNKSELEVLLKQLGTI